MKNKESSGNLSTNSDLSSSPFPPKANILVSYTLNFNIKSVKLLHQFLYCALSPYEIRVGIGRDFGYIMICKYFTTQAGKSRQTP